MSGSRGHIGRGGARPVVSYAVRTVAYVRERRPIDEVVAAYIAAVGCRDERLRRELIEAAVSEKFVFC